MRGVRMFGYDPKRRTGAGNAPGQEGMRSALARWTQFETTQTGS